MVHVHFDAKYRVDHGRELVGDADDDLTFEKPAESKDERRGVAKYDDLLKMHAYRDAIRRTGGAYVLYPGAASDEQKYQGFHEVLPGLGAFAIKPDSEGKALGMEELSTFLDDVIEHIANRTTARERVGFHLASAYESREDPVLYGTLHLPEADIFGGGHRALPPAEHMVLVAWYENDAQAALANQDDGFVFVRLGRRDGSLHIHPNLARVRHILLRTHQPDVAPGLLELRQPGLRVFTRAQLRRELHAKARQPGVAAWEKTTANDDEEYIYALFQTRRDEAWKEVRWSSDRLLDLIERFESDIRNKPIANVGRTSPYPRILPLRDLLKAMESPLQ